MKLRNRLLYGGEDERGVSVLRVRPSLGPVGCFFILGAFASMGFIDGIGKMRWYGIDNLMFTLGAVLAPACIFLGVGLWLLRLWWHIRKLRTVSHIAAQVGVGEEELTALADARGIRPRFNIERHDLYSMSDFDNAQLLLRPIAASDPNCLLHPASPGETDAGVLLRATCDDPESVARSSP